MSLRNLEITTQPNILFLRGVFAGDLDSDDTMFDNRFMSGAPDDMTIDPFINCIEHTGTELASIPTTFTTWQQWIKSTNLRCWNCDRGFKNPPIFVVDDVSYADGNRIITPHGNFCSDNCAQAYIDVTYRGVAHDDKTRYQVMLARERTGKNIAMIKPSIPKTCMKAYCGPNGITPDEYEKRLKELNNDYSLRDYKIEHLKTNLQSL